MQAGARINVGMTMSGSFLPQRIRKILEGGRVPRVSRTRMASLSRLARLCPLHLPLVHWPTHRSERHYREPNSANSILLA